jgi:hypothetical protein
MAAFYAYGEYQHDVLANKLGETAAQRQIDEVIKSLRAPYNQWKFKHGEE